MKPLLDMGAYLPEELTAIAVEDKIPFIQTILTS
jgi:hypothetical protein